MIMNQYSALLINLGQGSTRVDKNGNRVDKKRQKEELVAFFKEVVKEYQPDFILFQEGTSKQFLKYVLVKVLNENITEADFFQRHPAERGKNDLIGVKKNEILREWNGKSLEVHGGQASQGCFGEGQEN